MTGTTLPGKTLGMVGFDPSYGHTPWNEEMERNLRVLDSAVFGAVVQGFGLSFTPGLLELWIDSDTNAVALWTGGAWESYLPVEGWEVYVLSAHAKYRFNGTAWVLAGSGGSSGAVVFSQDAPDTIWGPMVHSFGRRASVELKDSAGQTIYGDVREVTTGQVFAIFSQPVTGSAILT